MKPVTIKVRAKESMVAGQRGWRFVRHRGEKRDVIGWYFALRPNGQVELHYVLRTVEDQLQSLTKRSGHMRAGRGKETPAA
jgi:hypothetical protein